jgi:hypothetical protein
MPDRKPDPWETGAPGPFLWIEGSPVQVWALGEKSWVDLSAWAPRSRDHAE